MAKKRWWSKYKVLKCPQCKKINDIEAVYCEHCEYTFRPEVIPPCLLDNRIDQRLAYGFNMINQADTKDDE